jgi:hypothetical protein
MRGPSFLSVAQWDRREERCPGRATERCERDYLRLVLRLSDSNEIRERTAMIESKHSTTGHPAYHLNMSRPRPESADSDTHDHLVAADALMRQEPDEEEEDEEEEDDGDGDGKEHDDDDEENDDGYSE